MKRRIVISDRDKQNARLLKAVLSPENYELYYVADPALCMAYVTANPPDILIADPLYPDAGGKRLIKSANSRFLCGERARHNGNFRFRRR